MSTIWRGLVIQGISLAAIRFLSGPSAAAPLKVANPSFETPIFADTGFGSSVSAAQQGGYGWTFSQNSGVYNPPAVDYTGAGGNGTPAGAHGAQVGWSTSVGDFNLYQRLAGPDGIVDNGDDPVLEPYTIYTLTVAVGARAAGNFYGATPGGYDIQLRAGPNIFATSLLANEANAVALHPGSLIDRTIVWDSAQANPTDLGLPLSLVLRITNNASSAATDFDNVRLNATLVPPSADFDGDGTVGGSDLTRWRTNFGMSDSATRMHGDYDRNSKVDGMDFLWWQRELGLNSAVTTPEPSAESLGLLCLGGSALAVRRWQPVALRM
jgi:hypothetical protein